MDRGVNWAPQPGGCYPGERRYQPDPVGHPDLEYGNMFGQVPPPSTLGTPPPPYSVESPIPTTAGHPHTSYPVPRRPGPGIDAVQPSTRRGHGDGTRGRKKSGQSILGLESRKLHYQFIMTHAFFTSNSNRWKNDKKAIPYAKRNALKVLWQDLLQSDFQKEEGDTDCAGMRLKIGQCMHDVIKVANSSNFSGNDYVADRRRRIIKKLRVSCDAIDDLIGKALRDPRAVRTLLRELDEAAKMVDPQENNELYKG